MNSSPPWLKKTLRFDEAAHETRAILKSAGAMTVCESSLCPNLNECFSRRWASFLILGTRCTRMCAFCSVEKGRPSRPDPREPQRVLDAVERLGLAHVVITSVTRDDLEDGGAGHFSNVVETIQAYRDDITIELLVPDFRGSREATSRVCEAGPDIFGHNIETVPRLYRSVRRGSDYRRSLLVLRWAKECSPGVLTKSAILVGLGEGRDEVRESLRDLRTAGCDIVAIGQYLRPSRDQLPVKEFVRPEEFTLYKEIAYDMGFRFVMSGPFVRSSFEAGEAYQRLKRKENFDYEGSSFAAAG